MSIIEKSNMSIIEKVEAEFKSIVAKVEHVAKAEFDALVARVEALESAAKAEVKKA